MKKDKLPTINQIKQWMQQIAKENGIEKQVSNTWRHSTVVWRFAEEIAKEANKNSYTIDFKLLKVGCYIHDIGRMVIGSKGSQSLKPGIFHFYEGYQILLKKGYPQLARICLSHACGAGLDKQTNKKYGFIAKNFFPLTIEERIIAYADARTDYKKGVGPCLWSFDRALNRFKKYPGVGKRLKANHQFIKKITNSKIS